MRADVALARASFALASVCVLAAACLGCTGEILGGFDADADPSKPGNAPPSANQTCDDAITSPRRLRLLTRGEYRSAVSDVLRAASSSGTVTLDFDPAATFPADARPENFPFDNASGLVTATHAHEYHAAAGKLAERVLQTLSDFAPCAELTDQSACALSFLQSFGARAFRRPLTTAETERYRALMLAQADFSQGVKAAVQSLFSSPHFLYRSEIGAPGAGAQLLDGYEVATALSFMFWGTTPDPALLAAAASGELAQPENIEREARRLLGDPRARDALAGFALQWLGVGSVLDNAKSNELELVFGDSLRGSMLEETKRFVSHVVFDKSGTFAELLTANYTLANAELASFYGMGAAAGEFAPLSYSDGFRSGLLGHGSVLSVYAAAAHSSPVKRGLFVRQRLLCQDLPPPPANIPPVPDVAEGASTRERFAQHTSSAGCAGCHQYIDPVGFGFEHFDAIGRLRTSDGGRPVDSSGDLTDVEAIGAGTHAEFASLPELARILSQSENARACLVRQYYRFARGADTSEEERCALERIQKRLVDAGGDVREMMVAVTQSPDFWRRR